MTMYTCLVPTAARRGEASGAVLVVRPWTVRFRAWDQGRSGMLRAERTELDDWENEGGRMSPSDGQAMPQPP